MLNRTKRFAKMTLKKYHDYVDHNRDIKYFISLETLPPVLATHKWVGAQNVGGCVYGIPNDMNAVLKHTEKKSTYLGDLGSDLFKWTGGCLWNDCLYGFPRSSNCLLKMPLDAESIELIDLEESYSKEHHYGGVCAQNGMIYQPPRDSDHILAWDLEIEKARRIYLVPESSNKKFRYCGSVLHPNGNAYFLPEMGERVICLETETRKWKFIGDPIDAMVFDAKIAVDGMIYGFSAYCDGILKLDVEKEHVEMIHREISPGAYGTKLGVNGHLYSIPGDGGQVWDYDPWTDSLKSIYQFPNDCVAKFAGGTSLSNGDICAVPARANQLLKLKTDAEHMKIPEDIYRDYFSDCY